MKLWLPQENKLPSHMSEWGEDFLEERLNKWQQANGIPDWLS